MPPPVSKNPQVLETCGSSFEHNLEIYARVAATWPLQTKPFPLSFVEALWDVSGEEMSSQNKESSRTPPARIINQSVRDPLWSHQSANLTTLARLVLPSSVPAQCLTVKSVRKGDRQTDPSRPTREVQSPPHFRLLLSGMPFLKEPP